MNRAWIHLEQATIWIRKSIEDSGTPCAHCLQEAKEHIALAEACGPVVE